MSMAHTSDGSGPIRSFPGATRFYISLAADN
jgi:hypothetical protein